MLPVWLPCPHHCRHLTFSQGSCRWRSDRAPGRSNYTQNRGWLCGHEPKQSDRPGNRGRRSDHHPGWSDRPAPCDSFITYFTNFHHAPRGAHNSTHATRNPGVHDSICASHGTGVPALLASPLMKVREPPSPPLHQQSPLMKVIPVSPPINPHSMTTQAKRGFQLPADKLTLSTTSSSLLSPVPTSVHAALTDLSWRRAMEEEYDAFDHQQHLRSCPSSCWIQHCHRQMDLQAQVQLQWHPGAVQGSLGPSRLHPTARR
jgi:hypothetical protein